MIEVEIQEKKDNPLLERLEVRFRAMHPNATTPKRDAIRDELAKLLNVKKELIVVQAMNAEHGLAATRGTANAYRSAEKLTKLEPAHLRKRHGMAVEEKLKAPEAPKKEAAAPKKRGA